MNAHTFTNLLCTTVEFSFYFSGNGEVIRSMSLLMEKPGDSVDGLVCVCHGDPLSFGEGQSHCDQRL